MSRIHVFCILYLCGSGGLLGCGADVADERFDPPVPVAEPQRRPSPPEVKPAADDGPATREFDGIRFTIPAGWREVELSQMQRSILDARFLIEAAGEEAQLTLSSVGGGIEANIARWKGEVDLPPGESPVIDAVEVHGATATWIDLRGTYRSAVSEDRGPHPDWRLVGVAIPKRPRDYYIKLIGPRDTVAAIYDEFRQFVKDARFTP